MPQRVAVMGARNSTLSNSEPPLEIPAEEEDNKNHLLTQLQEGYSRFHFQCRSCLADLSPNDLKANIEPWFDLKDHSPTAAGTPPPHYTAVKCSTCSASTCVGCGRKPRCHATRTAPFNPGMNSCCEKGRLLTIWLVLCRFDDRELEIQASAANTKDTPPSTKKNGGKKKSASKADVKDHGQGTGVGYATGPNIGLTGKQIAAVKPSDDNSDRQMIATLALLDKLLEPKENRTLPLPDVQDE